MYNNTNNIMDNGEQFKNFHELATIIATVIIAYLFSAYFDILEFIVGFAHKHEDLQLDEFITVFIVLAFVLTIYSLAKWRRLVYVNRVINQKNNELQNAFSEIKQLQGIIPICASCKKIRDDKGYWHQVESYIRNHSEAEFSHGICPDCMKKLYPDFEDEVEDESS